MRESAQARIDARNGAPALNPTAIPASDPNDPTGQLARLGITPGHPLAAFAQHVMKQRQRPQGFMWRGQFHPYGGRQQRQRMHPLHQALISAMAPPETGGVRPPVQGVPGFDPTTGAFTGPAAPQGVRAAYAGGMPSSGYDGTKGNALGRATPSPWLTGNTNDPAIVGVGYEMRPIAKPKPGMVGVGYEM